MPWSFVVALVNSGRRGHFLAALVSLDCHDPGCRDLAMAVAKRTSGTYPAGKRDRRGERKRRRGTPKYWASLIDALELQTRLLRPTSRDVQSRFA